jgi:glutamate synthase (NADPH/NADH) small chain
MLYRRTESDMSGYAHELAHARHEGVRLIERATPAAFVREGGVLKAVKLADGREIACELAVIAIGQARLGALIASFPGVEADAKGEAVVDAATGATGNPKVWVGGDACGGELVVTAAQDGKRAARAIAKALGLPARPDSPMNAGH